MINYQEISKKIRKRVLKMKYQSHEGHLGSDLSCVDILIVLYFGVLNIDPKDSLSENRDKFILSKGHAAAALYAVLAERGFFSEKALDEYCKNGSKLAGHPVRGAVEGIEATTGSLGHGFPIATGIALADKHDSKKSKTFVMVSDGECDEGTTWEAALFAAHHKLDNLVVLVDYNKFQAFGSVKDVLALEPFAKKWEDFGWNVKQIDGHNFSEIENVLKDTPIGIGKPSVIICNTIKGKGFPSLEGKLESHYKHLKEEKEYNNLLEELI